MRYLKLLSFIFSSTILFAQGKLTLPAHLLAPQPLAPPIAHGAPAGVHKDQPQIGTPRSINFLNQETVVGNTTYDLQSNAALSTRFLVTSVGQKAAVWMQSVERNTIYADRGTGFNHNPGSGWQEIPESRLESSTRTGWPSLSQISETQLHIVSHTATNTLSTITMNLDGSNVSEGFVPHQALPGLLWPRSAASGGYLHIIALTAPSGLDGAPYFGVDGHLLYYRSSDGGVNWDQTDIIIPGLDSSRYAFISADTYAIEARDSVVAVVVFGVWGDAVLFKSQDYGMTWQEILINDFPLDRYQIDDGYSEEDIRFDPNAPQPLAIATTDGSGDLLIDANGMVHATFSNGYVLDLETNDSLSSFFPGWIGISYWNEMQEIPLTVGGVIDYNENDTIDLQPFEGAIPRYSSHTITSMANISHNGKGELIIVYSALAEAFFNEQDEEHYRHLVAIKSLDNGASWGPPYDLINPDLVDDELYEFVEAVYPSVHAQFDDTLHLTYQQDFFPGHTFDEVTTDPFVDNFITHLAVPVELIPDASALSIRTNTLQPLIDIFPSPASSEAHFRIDEQVNIPVNVTLRDLSGRLLWKGLSKVRQGTVDLQGLNPGIYIIHFVSAQSHAAFKIIKN